MPVAVEGREYKAKILHFCLNQLSGEALIRITKWNSQCESNQIIFSPLTHNCQ